MHLIQHVTFTTKYLTLTIRKQTTLHRTIATSRPCPLEGVHHPSEPVLHNVRHISDCVAVREEIPSPGTVAVVVEPGAEDEVRGGAEEETAHVS